MERGDLVEVRRGEGLPCSAGIFEVAEGLVFTPEVSMSFLKILLNYCFCSWTIKI